MVVRGRRGGDAESTTQEGEASVVWLVLAPLSVQRGNKFQDFVWNPNLFSVLNRCPRFVGTTEQTEQAVSTRAMPFPSRGCCGEGS